MTINVVNYSDHLIRVHLISGGCRKPLPLELDPGTRDNAGFVKTPHTACGTVGVFTYDLSLSGSDPIEKMALMFSVPYDYTYFENWFAVGVFSSNKICNYDLYYEMYYNNHSDFVRGRAADGIIKYIHGDFVIKVSMSDSYTPYMRLKVKQKKNT